MRIRVKVGRLEAMESGLINLKGNKLFVSVINRFKFCKAFPYFFVMEDNEFALQELKEETEVL